jgi:phosphoribosylformylglycinamidine cyclo-ligase
MGLSYSDSGVDIEKGEHFVEEIKKRLPGDERKNIGLFEGLFELNEVHCKEPVLVASTDGVGTKLLLAKEAGIFRTIGIDLVAMCVNDIVTSGAKPLFFLDYMATSSLELNQATEIIGGIIEGCRLAGCRLLGGETAEMPGLYKKGDYELAGFAVGVVDRKELITGELIQSGDILIGLKSSGVHSNGMSLARKALFEMGRLSLSEAHPLLDRPLVQELLTPTRIYCRQVSGIIGKVHIKGIAHITGGGIDNNVKRLLPANLDLHIDWEAVTPQSIFSIIQQAGKVDIEEMRKTFNMGVGLIFVVDKVHVKTVISLLKNMDEDPLSLGEVVTA